MSLWLDPEAARPLHFGPDSTRLFGMLHLPPSAGAQLGVVVASPIVNEQVTAHRSLRVLARRLAARGLPTLRFDAPSTGDSSGADESDLRIGLWRDSLSWAAAELRSRTGVTQVAIVGVTLGATIAVTAVDEGLDAAGLVLWDPSESGEAWLREQRAYHRLALRLPPTPGDPQLPQGAGELAGFFLSPAAVEELRALDLTADPPRRWPAGLPVLLSVSGRRGRMPVAGFLRKRGAAVEERELPGLAEMLEEAERAQPPHEAVAAIGAWLEQLAEDGPAPVRPAAPEAQSAKLEGGVREQEFLVEGEAGCLFGITTEPDNGSAGGPWVVMFNAGFVRHIGPNRMYVRWARSWAQRGLPSLRVDGRSVGESDGSDGPYESLFDLYSDGAVADARAFLDDLRERRGATDLTLLGLCSGAYVAFHTALAAPGVRRIVLLNPQILSYDEEESDRDRAEYVRRSLFSAAKWRSMLTRSTARRQLRDRLGVVYRAGKASIVRRIRGDQTLQDDWLVDALARLHDRGVSVWFVMSAGDPGLSYLARHLGPDYELAPPGSFELQIVDGADHTFRPLGSQQRLCAIVDDLVGLGVSSADASDVGRSGRDRIREDLRPSV